MFNQNSKNAREKTSNDFDNTFNFCKKVKYARITLEEVKKTKTNVIQICLKQEGLKLDQVNNKVQEILYKTRNHDIKFFDDYSSIISETKNKTIHRDGIKILTPR